METTEQKKMTNKEAVQALKQNYPTSNYTMLREAVDLAIEKLENGQTTKIDEKTVWSLTIEEAIDTMMKNYPPESFKLMRDAVDLAMDALKNN